MIGPVVITHLALKCLEPDQCSVVFEPYGSEVVLVADDEIRIRIVTTEEARVEVAYSPGCITVWLPAATTAVTAFNRLDEPIDVVLPM